MLRADQWLILGVGALGIYALYRMNKSDSSIPSETPIPNPRPSIPTDQLPDRPGQVTLPANIAVIQGNPLQLTNSRAYFGRIETISPQGIPQIPFAPNLSKEQIQDILLNLGFDAVKVYMNPTEASTAISVPEALSNPGRGTRWFYGRWLNPSMNVERPNGLSLLWITRGLNAQVGLQFPYIIGGTIFNPEMYPLQYPIVMKD